MHIFDEYCLNGEIRLPYLISSCNLLIGRVLLFYTGQTVKGHGDVVSGT